MTVKDFLVEKAQDFLAAHAAELETLLNEVRARRNAICGLHSVIPETVAGCSTAHLRDSLEKLCIGLQTFDLILQGLTKTIREPCRDLSPDEERACLIEQIAKYGVILPENIDFDSETLRNILHALDAVGSRVADCIRGLVPPAPSLGYEFTPAGAFRLIFDPDNRPLTFSYDANRASALTQAFSAGDESAGPNMPIARFNITLAYSTIFFEDGTRRPNEIIEGNIIHELGHVFLRLLLEAEDYEVVEYQGETVNSDGFDVSNTYAFIVEYMQAIDETGATWNPLSRYSPGNNFASTEFLKAADDAIKERLRNLFFNATVNPQEDFVDSFSVYIRLGSANFLEENMASYGLKQELETTPRIGFFDSFCCWVYELIGLDLNVVGCRKAALPSPTIQGE